MNVRLLHGNLHKFVLYLKHFLGHKSLSYTVAKTADLPPHLSFIINAAFELSTWPSDMVLYNM